MSLDRRTLLKASALGVGGLAVSTAMPGELLPAAFARTPPTPDFGPKIEDYASYDGQTQCIGSEQPGVAAFKNLLLGAYPAARNLGIIRACGIGGQSEHKEGRAWDFGVYANRPNEAAIAQEVINWLLATDRHGNRHALARRLGIMYMIWNRKIWKSYSNPGTWHNYTGANPHTDHIHFSFSWPGARKQTTFWNSAGSQHVPTWGPWGTTVARCDSGPVADSWSPRKTDVFTTSSRGTLLHRWMVSGQGWGPGDGWRDLGSPPGVKLTSQPAAVARAEGLINVFVRGSDGALWQIYYTPSSSWSRWTSLGGVCRSAPAAASWSADHLIVMTLGGGGAVWERSWAGRWYPWRRVPGGSLTSAPAVTSWGKGRIDVFGRGPGGDLLHNVYQTGKGWMGFRSRGGVLSNATPAAVSMYKGRVDAFVIGTNGAIYRKRWEDRWLPPGSAWDNLGSPGGGAVSGVGVTSLNPNHLELFARGADGRLHQRSYA